MREFQIAKMDLQGASKTSRFCKCKKEREANRNLREQISKEITMLWLVVRLLILQLAFSVPKGEFTYAFESQLEKKANKVSFVAARGH